MRFGIIRSNEPGQAFCTGLSPNEVVILTESSKAGHVYAKRYPAHNVPTAGGDIPHNCVFEVEDPAAYLHELYLLSGSQYQQLTDASNQARKLAEDYEKTSALYQSALRLLELHTVNNG